MNPQNLATEMIKRFNMPKANPALPSKLPDLNDSERLGAQLTEYLKLLIKHDLLRISSSPEGNIKSWSTEDGIGLLTNYGMLPETEKTEPKNLELSQLRCASSESEEAVEILTTVILKLADPGMFNTFFVNSTFSKTTTLMTAGLLCALVTRISTGIGNHSQDDNYDITSYIKAYKMAFKTTIDPENWGTWEMRIYQLFNLMRPANPEILEGFNDSPSPFHDALDDTTINDDAILAMIEQGALVNDEDSCSETPLNLAITCGRGEAVITMLLDKGANINTRDKHGDAPLHLAIQYKKPEIVTLLLNQKDINVSIWDRAFLTPIYYAANKNQPDLVAQLLKRGIILSQNDIHYNDEKGNTLLHVSIALGMDALSFLLIEKGANCNAMTHKGYTPLCIAILMKNPDVAIALMAHGATLSSQDVQYQLGDKKLTLLHLAADMGLTDAMQQMLKHGMDIRVTDEKGNNSLHHAVMSRVKKTSLVLLNAPGIDDALNHRNKKGKTPREYAAKDMDIVHDPELLSKFFTAKQKKSWHK
ncbi:MAG: ankyrin repeat domain-containing protein [Gammaproteobacteria bacterium]